MQVQLSQSTALQIRDASSQRGAVSELGAANEAMAAELKELRREKETWDERLSHVMAQAGREKAASSARIHQMEQDMRKLLQNVQSSSAGLSSMTRRTTTTAPTHTAATAGHSANHVSFCFDLILVSGGVSTVQNEGAALTPPSHCFCRSRIHQNCDSDIVDHAVGTARRTCSCDILVSGAISRHKRTAHTETRRPTLMPVYPFVSLVYCNSPRQWRRISELRWQRGKHSRRRKQTPWTW